MDMTVTIDLEHTYVGEGTTMMDLVIADAARQLLEKVGRDEGVEMVRQQVRAMRDTTIRKRVQPLIDAALEAAINPVNALGEPVAAGGRTTLSEYIVKQMTGMLQKKTDGGYNKPSLTYLQSLVVDAVDAAVRREMKDALDAGKQDVLQVLREHGAALIQETIGSIAKGRLA